MQEINTAMKCDQNKPALALRLLIIYVDKT